MKKRFTPIFIAALLVLTAIAAAWHLTARTPDTPGAIAVTFGENQTILHAGALTLTDLQGEIVNGKGETIFINAQGVSLPDLLAAAGAENASAAAAIASDAYSARLTAGEFDRAYIILQDDGSFRLVVFSDPDSRRAVRNLTEVIAE